MSRLFSLRRLALVSVLFFGSLTGYTLLALLDLQDELSEDVGENMVWAVGQATYQASLLSIAQGSETDAGGGYRSNPLIQRALLRARMQVLLAPTQADFMGRAGVLEQVRAVDQALQQGDFDPLKLHLELYEIGRQVMQVEREVAGERRDAYKRLMRQLIVFVFGVMASGIVLCLQLLRSLKRTREAHDEIARQHTQARELLDSLQRERQARMRYRDFVSLMSHQLRTPLAVIDSSAQRLLRQDGDTGREDAVAFRSQRIRRAVRQLNQLIARVLQGLRVDEQERDGGVLEIVRCDWGDVLQQAIDGFGDLLAERCIQVVWAPGSERPVWIACDRSWCVEILSNLISNADKYSPKDGAIEIHIEKIDGMLHCQVRDQGPGISPQELDGLFQRFFRGASSGMTAGVGLGLSIARTLAHWHGGTLTASNNAQGGACFTLTLPLSGNGHQPPPADA